MARPAAEIEPVSRICSRSSILPRPSRSCPEKLMRRMGFNDDGCGASVMASGRCGLPSCIRGLRAPVHGGRNGQATARAYLIFSLMTHRCRQYRRRETAFCVWIGKTMSAYIISDVTAKDADAFQTYRSRAAASIARYGGRYLVRGGPIEQLEGNWAPRAIIVVEFPDIERARTWYRSPEYAFALEVRDRALSRNLILLDGISPES